MKTKGKKPLLLAPAGSSEALRAAVEAGCDAVYLGAGKFSARASAQNFHGGALEEAIDFARGHGVLVYLAVNTLTSDREMYEVLRLVEAALQWGAAAFIVQDMGLGQRIKAAFGGAVLHASTQMTARSLDDVKMLAQLGFARVVMARELSFDDLAQIAAGIEHSGHKIELEVFVHGALCASYSGQCLMSSFIGGRSANRGRCAQPCRLPYKTGKKTAAAPVLSLKDLCLIDHVAQLGQIGISALKIEGRMKGAEYVKTVVGAYRRALDGHKISFAEKAALLSVFDRGGYTNGYFTANHEGMYMKALKNPYVK
jgi:putative protease